MKTRILASTALLLLITATSGCPRSQPPADGGQPEQQSSSEAATGTTDPDPISTPSVTPQPVRVDPLALTPPTFQRLTDLTTSPFVHNPVTWRYLTVRYDDGVPSSDFRVAFTTTAERTLLPGEGVVFRLVMDLQGPGPYSLSQGEGAPGSEFQSRVAMLTPNGMYWSRPNPGVQEIAVEVEQLSEAFALTTPDWPLPGAPGCEHRVVDVGLVIGETTGVETRCEDVDTTSGQANVRTVWVDRVGFVYREIEPVSAEGDTVFREFLVGGDAIELAPALTGEHGPTEQLMP